MRLVIWDANAPIMESLQCKSVKEFVSDLASANAIDDPNNFRNDFLQNTHNRHCIALPFC